jgi:hypothetical protein
MIKNVFLFACEFAFRTQQPHDSAPTQTFVAWHYRFPGATGLSQPENVYLLIL